jgi:hypothetical protein
MKHEHQEDGEPRGPLILVAPASNLVAILSLDGLDRTNQPAVSAKGDRWEQSSKSVDDPERLRQDLRGGQLTHCAYGAGDIWNLIVYASRQIDHHAVTRRQSRDRI